MKPERDIAPIKTVVTLTSILIASLAAVTTTSTVQDADTTIWKGVYTDGQADRGKLAYDRHCSSCHSPDLSGSLEARPLAGDRFMQDWSEDTLNTLFTRVRDLMPFDDPGTLDDAIYLDSIAYILKYNGFPSGEHELVAEGLEDVRIESKDGPGPVPSFALVQVIGCLERNSDDAWALSYATDAQRTRDPAGPNSDELRVLETLPLGSKMFELMSVYPDPASHEGHKVQAKGFLIRDPEEGDRINISSLTMISADCQP
mgnify:CR=1 FL=1